MYQSGDKNYVLAHLLHNSYCHIFDTRKQFLDGNKRSNIIILIKKIKHSTLIIYKLHEHVSRFEFRSQE